ncbi:MAG: hypothetical protein NPIRA04_19310 [Nitrospirales bacterium]|nr:MAG: hypothetical protein NPIRA04_19310 [Nitrospirales bacterium]
MNFDNAVVVDSQGIADGVLGDFKPSVEISSQGSRKVKPDRESERMCFEVILENGTVRR